MKLGSASLCNFDLGCLDAPCICGLEVGSGASSNLNNSNLLREQLEKTCGTGFKCQSAEKQIHVKKVTRARGLFREPELSKTCTYSGVHRS